MSLFVDILLDDFRIPLNKQVHCRPPVIGGRSVIACGGNSLFYLCVIFLLFARPFVDSGIEIFLCPLGSGQAVGCCYQRAYKAA